MCQSVPGRAIRQEAGRAHALTPGPSPTSGGEGGQKAERGSATATSLFLPLSPGGGRGGRGVRGFLPLSAGEWRGDSRVRGKEPDCRPFGTGIEPLPPKARGTRATLRPKGG